MSMNSNMDEVRWVSAIAGVGLCFLAISLALGLSLNFVAMMTLMTLVVLGGAMLLGLYSV
jgi:energy-converting hydrogenase Eha subunit E